MIPWLVFLLMWGKQQDGLLLSPQPTAFRTKNPPPGSLFCPRVAGAQFKPQPDAEPGADFPFNRHFWEVTTVSTAYSLCQKIKPKGANKPQR